MNFQFLDLITVVNTVISTTGHVFFSGFVVYNGSSWWSSHSLIWLCSNITCLQRYILCCPRVTVISLSTHRRQTARQTDRQKKQQMTRQIDKLREWSRRGKLGCSETRDCISRPRIVCKCMYMNSTSGLVFLTCSWEVRVIKLIT